MRAISGIILDSWLLPVLVPQEEVQASTLPVDVVPVLVVPEKDPESTLPVKVVQVEVDPVQESVLQVL